MKKEPKSNDHSILEQYKNEFRAEIQWLGHEADFKVDAQRELNEYLTGKVIYLPDSSGPYLLILNSDRERAFIQDKLEKGAVLPSPPALINPQKGKKQ